MKTQHRDPNAPHSIGLHEERPTNRAWPTNFAVLLLLALTGGLALALIHASALATAPGLTIALSTNDGVLLTVTNGESSEFYEIYSTNSIADYTAWSLSITGSVGQTNFYVPMGPATAWFFKARAGNDWDGDGIRNFQDANPNNTNVGVLSVTIDTPANGSTLY